jgi:hypothetical protein
MCKNSTGHILTVSRISPFSVRQIRWWVTTTNILWGYFSGGISGSTQWNRASPVSILRENAVSDLFLSYAVPLCRIFRIGGSAGNIGKGLLDAVWTEKITSSWPVYFLRRITITSFTIPFCVRGLLQRHDLVYQRNCIGRRLEFSVALLRSEDHDLRWRRKRRNLCCRRRYGEDIQIG